MKKIEVKRAIDILKEGNRERESVREGVLSLIKVNQLRSLTQDPYL